MPIFLFLIFFLTDGLEEIYQINLTWFIFNFRFLHLVDGRFWSNGGRLRFCPTLDWFLSLAKERQKRIYPWPISFCKSYLDLSIHPLANYLEYLFITQFFWWIFWYSFAYKRVGPTNYVFSYFNYVSRKHWIVRWYAIKRKRPKRYHTFDF